MAIAGRAAIICVGGCSGQATAPASSNVRATMDSVNLLLNPDSSVDEGLAGTLRHVQDRFIGSGLFRHIWTGAVTGAVTLRADYSAKCLSGPNAAAELFLGTATAATLFLVPHQETCDYTIATRFMRDGRVIAERSYTATYRKTIQLFGFDQARGDAHGVDAVFDKLERDWQTDPPLARS